MIVEDGEQVSLLSVFNYHIDFILTSNIIRGSYIGRQAAIKAAELIAYKYTSIPPAQFLIEELIIMLNDSGEWILWYPLVGYIWIAR